MTQNNDVFYEIEEVLNNMKWVAMTVAKLKQETLFTNKTLLESEYSRPSI